ncbi:hypothetical protein GBA52_004098 [Prunus armeniaca]|nr:hypothetical protein GBA52_004098 [Prunus armeniaca]
MQPKVDDRNSNQLKPYVGRVTFYLRGGRGLLFKSCGVHLARCLHGSNSEGRLPIKTQVTAHVMVLSTPVLNPISKGLRLVQKMYHVTEHLEVGRTLLNIQIPKMNIPLQSTAK